MRHIALDELRVQHQQRVGGDGTLGRWACHSACFYRIDRFVEKTDHPGLQHVSYAVVIDIRQSALSDETRVPAALRYSSESTTAELRSSHSSVSTHCSLLKPLTYSSLNLNVLNE